MDVHFRLTRDHQLVYQFTKIIVTNRINRYLTDTYVISRKHKTNFVADKHKREEQKLNRTKILTTKY